MSRDVTNIVAILLQEGFWPNAPPPTYIKYRPFVVSLLGVVTSAFDHTQLKVSTRGHNRMLILTVMLNYYLMVQINWHLLHKNALS